MWSHRDMPNRSGFFECVFRVFSFRDTIHNKPVPQKVFCFDKNVVSDAKYMYIYVYGCIVIANIIYSTQVSIFWFGT